MFGVHTFNPTQALRYFAPGSNVSNSVDFTDNSSFHVSGTVRYNNTNVPVQGVSVLVDGTMAIKNRAPVTSDANGLFKIDVPIGFHRITLSKQGHSFVDGFPTKNYVNANGNLDSLYDFENDIVSPITFYDSTLATIAGRVAGGIVQQAKPLGFGLSKSNPGYGKITLNLQSNGLLHSNPGILSEYLREITLFDLMFVINQNKITIYPDTVTGEYAVKLPPVHILCSQRHSREYCEWKYVSFDNSFLGTINLDINKKDSSRYFFIDSVLVNKHKIAHFDSSIYRFNQRYDFILRNTPVIQVSQENQNFFGDSLIVFTDANNKPLTPCTSLKRGLPVRHSPILMFITLAIRFSTSRLAYIFKIKVYEEYKNLVNGKVEDIPQIDGGTLVISNSLSNNTNISDTLDSNGSMVYNFAGGAQTLFHPLR